ncbi:MAG: acyl-CoA thioesterase, partial [Actinobacteria bacterium]|nr:acyl-CoA thioesterase [Actinomycetota bacterium]NIS29075.1 acyl-CoA thioesterase [Actinomycetota bacterium]NIT94323.1 acyl-CoA thioesterase [Actinomycetota bacterium]NIU17936.1 acyl-CoA thioesterase [Actinomycetota bacterium]NIU64481.1 acyl-CoA thioesterase [Actinomycetota bacterium]
LDAGAADAYRSVVDPPDVPGPLDCPPHHFGVTGRDIRVVDGAYNHDPDDVGPPELHVWMRHRDGPDDPLLHAALLA